MTLKLTMEVEKVDMKAVALELSPNWPFA